MNNVALQMQVQHLQYNCPGITHGDVAGPRISLMVSVSRTRVMLFQWLQHQRATAMRSYLYIAARPCHAGCLITAKTLRVAGQKD